MKSIETKRLRLRHWNEDDYANFAAFYADDFNAKYVGGLKNSDEAWRLMALNIGHWQLKGFGYWAVDEKGTGEPPLWGHSFNHLCRRGRKTGRPSSRGQTIFTQTHRFGELDGRN